MKIDIDRLPKEGLRVAKDFDFSSLDLVDENAVFLEPVQAEVFIKRLGAEEVLVQGQVTTKLSFVCSRCLTPFEFPVDSRFDLVYLSEELAEMRDELSEEDLDRMFYHDRELDVGAVVLEQLNLAFPTKPLCSATCEGICAVCGAVIRDGSCSCAVKESDPRLERLQFIVKDRR